MSTAHNFTATFVAQDAQTQAQARAQADQARANAEQAKAQAEQFKEQMQQFKENLREQIRSTIEQQRDAQARGIQIPPIPPIPPIPDLPDHYTETGPQFQPEIPREAVEIVSIVGMTLVFCVVGFPIARAFARWLDRRGTVTATSSDVSTRLRAIEQAVESVAVEVERISEGQRFTTRVLSERAAEPAGDFLAREREPVHIGLAPDSGPGAPINARRS